MATPPQFLDSLVQRVMACPNITKPPLQVSTETRPVEQSGSEGSGICLPIGAGLSSRRLQADGVVGVNARENIVAPPLACRLDRGARRVSPARAPQFIESRRRSSIPLPGSTTHSSITAVPASRDDARRAVYNLTGSSTGDGRRHRADRQKAAFPLPHDVNQTGGGADGGFRHPADAVTGALARRVITYAGVPSGSATPMVPATTWLSGRRRRPRRVNSSSGCRKGHDRLLPTPSVVAEMKRRVIRSVRAARKIRQPEARGGKPPGSARTGVDASRSSAWPALPVCRCRPARMKVVPDPSPEAVIAPISSRAPDEWMFIWRPAADNLYRLSRIQVMPSTARWWLDDGGGLGHGIVSRSGSHRLVQPGETRYHLLPGIARYHEQHHCLPCASLGVSWIGPVRPQVPRRRVESRSQDHGRQSSSPLPRQFRLGPGPGRARQ